MTFHFQQADKFRRLILFHLSVVRFQREVDSISNAKKNRLLHKILIIIIFFFFLRNVSFCLLDNIALRNRKQVASNASAIKEPSDKLRRNECRRLSYRRHSFTDCISELLVSKKTKKTKHGHKQTNILHSKPKKKKRNEEKERVTRLWHRPCNSINDVIFARRVIPHTKNGISGAKLSIQSDHTQRERHSYRLKKKKKTFFQDQRTTLSSEWGEFLQEARISNTVEKKIKITKNLRNTKIRMR